MRETPSDAGFSLTELLVAMLVTLLVSGAVFGLLSAGQSAFKREPELTERQQNIRMAMDLIQRDIAVAGLGLTTFDQVFTPLDGFTGGANAPSGQPGGVDALELLGSTGECPEVRIASVTTVTLTTAFPLPRCFGTDGPVAVTMSDSTVRWGFAHGMAENGPTVAFTGTQPGRTTVYTNFPASPTPVSVSRLQWVRYQIGTDPTDGAPALFRSESGGFNPATGGAVVFPDAAAWQLVARGIEDLQVRYRSSAVGSVLQPVAVVPAVNNWNTLTQQVEVTLWARAITPGPAAQGQTSPNGSVAARRGALTSLTTPRSALYALNAAPAPWTWN